MPLAPPNAVSGSLDGSSLPAWHPLSPTWDYVMRRARPFSARASPPPAGMSVGQERGPLWPSLSVCFPHQRRFLPSGTAGNGALSHGPRVPFSSAYSRRRHAQCLSCVLCILVAAALCQPRCLLPIFFLGYGNLSGLSPSSGLQQP